MNTKFKRGTVWFCDFIATKYVNGKVAEDVTISGVQSGMRPVLIVSNDMNNHYSEAINVVPLTSKVKKPLPCHINIKSSENIDSIILCEQIRTINKDALKRYEYTLDPEDMVKVEAAIAGQLGIDLASGISKDALLAAVENLIKEKEAELTRYRTHLVDDSIDQITASVQGMINRVKTRCNRGLPNDKKEIILESDPNLSPVISPAPIESEIENSLVKELSVINKEKESIKPKPVKKNKTKRKPSGFWTKEIFEEFNRDKESMPADEWASKWEFENIENCIKTFYSQGYRYRKGLLV